MIDIGEILLNLWQGSGFNAIFANFASGGWQNLVMLIIACVLLCPPAAEAQTSSQYPGTAARRR